MSLFDDLKQEIESGGLTEYNETTAALNELKNTYGTEVPDASTKEGYSRCKEIAGKLTKLRTSLESKRKDIKSPAIELGKMVDSEARRIESEIRAIESPFKDAYRAVDEEKKKRKEAIEERMLKMVCLPSDHAQSTPVQIEVAMEELACTSIDVESFGRRVEEAHAKFQTAMSELELLHVKAIEREVENKRIAEERAELDRLRRESEEREAAERRAKEEKEQAERATRFAEQQAKEAEERIEREKQEAIEAERARVEEENRIAEEQVRAREADRAHRRTINCEVLDAFIENGFSTEDAKKIITLVASKEIPHMVINY